MRVTIEMTRSDTRLNKSARSNPYNCPVAKAIRRHFGCNAACGFISATVYSDDLKTRGAYDLDESTQVAIREYDSAEGHRLNSRFPLPHTIYLRKVNS